MKLRVVECQLTWGVVEERCLYVLKCACQACSTKQPISKSSKMYTNNSQVQLGTHAALQPLTASCS